MTTVIEFKKGQGDRYARVLEEKGATEQEFARFAHLAKRSAMGPFAAIILIEAGTPVAEAIDGFAEVARKQAGR
jgi:hypothetical protein